MTIKSPSELLIAEAEGRWLTLTMKDAERRNALSEDMSAALSSVLEQATGDRSLRGITLRGANGVFCSGGDLKGMGRFIMGRDQQAIHQMSQAGGRLFAQIQQQPQVVVAVIDGPAMAGGLGMACCADLIAVTQSAKFALTEVNLGIPPAQIAPYLVARLGLSTAKRLMLTAATFGAEEAMQIGLADHMAADGSDLETWLATIKSQVLQCAPEALAATKRIALQAAIAAPTSLQDDAATAFTDCLLSEEGAEGIASFLGKRKPNWAE